MPFEPVNFAERAQLSEWMDEPCSYEEFRDCLRDLAKVNRMVLAYRPTLNWLEQFAGRIAGPLNIVDVGCGGGDMLRRIEGWARKRKIRVRLTGIDLNPHAARVAREFTDPGSSIEWLTCDAFQYQPSQPIDIVLSSLFTHHLSEDGITRFLQWMEGSAARGWFINDLRRARASYYLFKLLALGMRWHRFVRHDGPVSILRSFAPEDWKRYVEEAGTGADSVRIVDAWPARLCVARVK